MTELAFPASLLYQPELVNHASLPESLWLTVTQTAAAAATLPSDPP